MFLAAVGHHYSFTIHPYTEVIMTKKTWQEAIYALLDFSDVGADIKEHLGVVGKLIFDTLSCTRACDQIHSSF